MVSAGVMILSSYRDPADTQGARHADRGTGRTSSEEIRHGGVDARKGQVGRGKLGLRLPDRESYARRLQ